MNSLIGFLPFVLILAGFIYFQGRRQRRAMQATIDLHESLRPGDRVHTTSGMEATVVAINDGTVELEIAPGVVTTWMTMAVRDRIEPDDEVDLDEDDEAEDLAESDEPEESADSADQNRAVKGDT
jgi:preprotein translocase subunit YajC